MEISTSIKDRVRDETFSTAKTSAIDIHCHVFNFDNIPDGFLGIRLPFTKRFLKFVSFILHHLNPFSHKNILDNYGYFIDVGRKRKPEEITLKLFDYYPQDTVFCPLLMDMQPTADTGIKGKVHKDYMDQILDMVALVSKYPTKLMPFVAIDPRRKDVIEKIFLPCFQDVYWKTFVGIKIYPSIRYLPSHPILMEIFKICEEKGIPIITHCSYTQTYSSYRDFTVQHVEGDKIITDHVHLCTGDAICNYFNHPRNWEQIGRAHV